MTIPRLWSDPIGDSRSFSYIKCSRTPTLCRRHAGPCSASLPWLSFYTCQDVRAWMNILIAQLSPTAMTLRCSCISLILLFPCFEVTSRNQFLHGDFSAMRAPCGYKSWSFASTIVLNHTRIILSFHLYFDSCKEGMGFSLEVPCKLLSSIVASAHRAFRYTPWQEIWREGKDISSLGQ